MPRHATTFGRAERLAAPRRTLAVAVLDQARRDVQRGHELGEDELEELRWWARRARLSPSIVSQLDDTPRADD
jgi:hypothetical protein